MKKISLLILVLIFAVNLFACSNAAGGAPNKGEDYDAMYPNGVMGDALEGELDQSSPNYNYEEVRENGFITTEVNPNSTFSLDRNTASYSISRKIINGGSKLPKDSVRIEEFVNYFTYGYERPQGDQKLALGGSLSYCPWNLENYLFTVNLTAPEISFENAKQNNFVFLIDVSGSMTGMDRLGLIQQAFVMLAENLADNDIVSIVTYASGTRVAAEGLLGSQKAEIIGVLQDLTAGGSTNGAGGIQLAYDTAQKYFIEGGNNRIILATDGDFNVGIANKNQLYEFISEKRDLGVWLSVLGVGMYNTNDTIMKTLAENGNGNYGYIDTVDEAKRLLVTEMGGTLNTIAKDVKINVEFKAEVVKKYRLIGYETKMMSTEDFEDEAKDAGEIGSGHMVTAVYELVLEDGGAGAFATAEVRFKDPETNEQMSVVQNYATEDLLYVQPQSEDTVFIGCVVEFGLLVRESEYKAQASFDNIVERLEMLSCVVGENADSFKSEFLELVKKARVIYQS